MTLDLVGQLSFCVEEKGGLAGKGRGKFSTKKGPENREQEAEVKVFSKARDWDSPLKRQKKPNG